MKTKFKFILLTCLAQMISLDLFPQKLPNKQTVSLWAPANLKIDGKTTEWNNHFQAYNRAVEIYYTLSNDDKNLYLTVQATNRAIINKIINGGISFSITPSAKKNQDAITITYPVFESYARPGLNTGKAFFEQSSTNIALADSIVTLNNRRLEEKSKLIMVTGIREIDTLISVYNDHNIKVAEKFDSKMAYTYELAVALANLGLSTNKAGKFNYHIVLNGESILPERAPVTSLKQVRLSPDMSDGLVAAKLGLEAQTTSPTDFWGEYTLAKN
ncbi:hypothetical protein [Mucilaginibacter sp. UR6-11]|uniref:hypothetical protein n=1 Tax=Mucilaginibacter sp. UR6-11 TaxID=1435644 RepID=UPI001E36D6C8|nr:hypothetical protein [Mucilaginibacter sp. UR6-11]MCC8425482.1 hypothetical protein [Mucilaginibacter sp. UR6-11]